MQANLGSRIQYFRERQGVTQKELAIAVDIDPASMCRIEKSDSQNASTLRKIADALGIPTFMLFLPEPEARLSRKDREIIESYLSRYLNRLRSLPEPGTSPVEDAPAQASLFSDESHDSTVSVG